jgi:hypothetical protein
VKLKPLTEAVGALLGKVPQPFSRDIKDFPVATHSETTKLERIS